MPVIDRLEKDGLIARVQDPEDRRRNRLVLKEKGTELLKQTDFLDQENLLATGLASMMSQEREDLNRLLQTLIRAMSPQTTLVDEVLNNLHRLEIEKSQSGDE